MIWLLVGLIAGAVLGMIIMALLVAASPHGAIPAGRSAAPIRREL